MSDLFRITLAQINPVVGDFNYNIDKIRHARAKAAAQKADLIVFPEMALCGYHPEDLILRPSFLAHVRQSIDALAADTAGGGAAHMPWMIVPAPWQPDPGGPCYNAALILGEGKIQNVIYKHHLPNYGVFDDARVFAPGPLPVPVEVRGWPLGLMICEDMWHADVAAHLKKNGAGILLVVNGSPFEAGKAGIRAGHAGGRITETGLPLIYVNQVGGQDELVFDGNSFVMDARGQMVAQLAAFDEDLRTTDWTRPTPGNDEAWQCAPADAPPVFLNADTGQDEKEERELKAIYQALCLGLSDYVGKNGFPGVVLGLSGGIDSALSAAIAADALGPEKVHCVMMPSPFTSDQSREDATATAAALGCALETYAVDPAMRAFEALLPGLKNTAHENIQSRCRGLILMALSNMRGHMVLSTGNKSEMAVGYATLYGDMCGGFNVLKDVYKTQVYALARWRNRQGAAEIIPQRVLTRPPSAELKPDQTDQDSLPPYDVLDAILTCLIEHDMGIEEIVQKAANGVREGRQGNSFDRALVLEIWEMLDRAEYKRRQAAPGVKITHRAFGRDRRYPVTNRFLKNIEKA